MQEIEDEFQPGIVHPEGRAQVLNATELAQAPGIEQRGFSGLTGDGPDEALFLVVEDGPGVEAGQFSDDFQGIADVGFIVINRKISIVQ